MSERMQQTSLRRLEGAYLNIVAAGYSACVLDSGCQVAALRQSLEDAACGIVELAHLRGAGSTAYLEWERLTLVEVLSMKQGMQQGDAVWIYDRQCASVRVYFQIGLGESCSQRSACQGAQDLARAGILHQRHRGGVD